MWKTVILVVALAGIAGHATAAELDHDHRAWSDLLGRHVQWLRDGSNTQVDYGGLNEERPALQAYLDRLSAVELATFRGWSKADRNAFMINAYNAWTILLVLDHYPDIESIRDIGGPFSSPWKQRFAALLGATRTLGEIEQELLRGAPDFDEPRIHFAVNCALIAADSPKYRLSAPPPAWHSAPSFR